MNAVQDELMGMLETRGIQGEGRKQELVDMIWEHDQLSGSADDIGLVKVSSQSAVATSPRVAMKVCALQ